MTNKIRGKRTKGNPVALTQRDFDLLVLIGLCRYVSTPQLAREFFTSIDRCRHRLRQLFNAGLVNFTLVSSTSPNLVSLTRAGLNTAIERQPELEPYLRMSGPIRSSGIVHHLLNNDIRLYVSTLAKTGGMAMLHWSNSGGERWGLNEFHLEPDGLCELLVAGETFQLAIEADTGTESLTTLGGKLEKYGKAFEADLLHELWFVVASGEQRKRNVAELISDCGQAERTRLIDHACICARPVLQPPPRAAQEAWLRKKPNTTQFVSHND